MIFTIKNTGEKRPFKTSQGYLTIGRGETIELSSERIAAELERYDEIVTGEINKSVPERIPEIREAKSDYSTCTIQTLRSFAAMKGIKNTFSMKKKALIKALT